MRGDPEAMPAAAAARHRPPEANLFIIRGFRSRVKPARWERAAGSRVRYLSAGAQPYCLGSLAEATRNSPPAALSHAIGSDRQRPFAIVIVGGLLANLVIGVFLLPTLYVWMAREDDVLPAVESTEEF